MALVKYSFYPKLAAHFPSVFVRFGTRLCLCSVLRKLGLFSKIKNLSRLATRYELVHSTFGHIIKLCLWEMETILKHVSDIL